MEFVKKIGKILLVCGILFPNVIFSQIEQVDPCGGGGTTLPPAVQNSPYCVRLRSLSAGPWSWSRTGEPLGSGLSIFNLGGGFAELRSNSVVLAAGTYTGLSISDGTNSMLFDFDVLAACPTSPPCGTEFAFVLDQSGSMGSTVPGGGTRWEKLIECMASYMPAIRTLLSLGANDRWSITLFEGNNATIIDTRDFDNLPNLSSGPGGLFNGISPGGVTPMGGGIQRALQDFFVSSKVPWKRQVVVVLTDGRQNMNPKVQGSPNKSIFNDPLWSPLGGILMGGTNLGQLPIDLSSTNPINAHIKLHSIGIGVSSSTLEFDLLSAFSTASLFFHTDGSVTNLAPHLTSVGVSAFQGCTPRILEMNLETISQSNQSRTIVVNDSTHYLALQFLAENSFSDPRIEIYYNDTIQDFSPVLRNNKQILYRIDFLSSRNGFIRRGKGTWRVTFSDSKVDGAMPMLFTALVEDKNIHHSIDFNGVNKFYAGDAIPVRVKIEKDQEPLNKQVAVKAFLLRPGDDLGDLAARNAFDPPGSINPDLTPGQVKMDFIAGNKKFSDLLKTLKIPEITLSPNGNGEYVGSFQGNEVTGAYQVVSYIQGSYPALGSFQGRESRFAHVDFSRPEDIRLMDKLIFLGKGDIGNKGSNLYQIQIRPINKFGRFLGPAQESRIKFTLSNGNLGTIRDNLDGTYSATLEVEKGTNPSIGFHVIDFNKPVEVKKLSRYDSLGFAICLAAGVSIPSQNLQNFKPGIYGEIGFGYRFTPNIGFELLGGGYTFRSNYHILGATLWGKYTFNQVVQPLGLDLNLGLGAGVFKPKGMNTELGYGLRAGLSKNLKPGFRLGLDFSLFNLSDSNISFATIGLGAQFRL